MVKAPVSQSPSADPTRQALLDAATSVFAEQGYRDGSVRAITRAAGANQAAITYHFGGKDGLYRAVLRAAVASFDELSLISEQAMAEFDRAVALRLVVRQFLLPLTQQGRLGRYVQIFGREGFDPSPVYMAFFAEEPPRVFRLVEQLVRRFLPPAASDGDVALTAFWLVQQPIAVVRNASRLEQPPYRLAFDAAGVDRLVGLLTDLSLGALERAGEGRMPDGSR